MASVDKHLEIMRIKREGACTELKAGRLSNFADLIFKAAEQAVEALLSLEVVGEKHSRLQVREFLREKYPALVEKYDSLYAIYQELGYPPAKDGEKAEKAKEIAEQLMGKCLDELGRREK